MVDYDPAQLEAKWQEYWRENQVFKAETDPKKPKYYVLDMFPYPSGSGLHVGHPLGYIATDIVARYKRITGFNVLHPMGFDSFGLPAEQFALKTGRHPAITTEQNVKRYKQQLAIMGFSYEWEREVKTSDPSYYKWTQWIFLKIFNSFFDKSLGKACPIEELEIPHGLSHKERNQYIDDHRLAYQAEVAVNWCPALGTVLANEEVIGGVSERGGYPVIRKPMKQWMLRITEYSDRLLDGLEDLDWPESIKTSQRNWIGKSTGAEIRFTEKSSGEPLKVFTTRPDTIFGVTYMVLAPEHALVDKITTDNQKEQVANYGEQASKKSDLERTDLDKTKTGVFSGAFAVNPLNGEEIPIWISDYVLISYGTGAVMAVPAHDQRDFEFASKFKIPIREVISISGKPVDKLKEAFEGHGYMLNSGEYDGLTNKEFTREILQMIEENDFGKALVNYKLRDWIFTRQRYWGEPIPVIHCQDGQTVAIPEADLPLILPEVESYEPSSDGESPLANQKDWVMTSCNGSGSGKRETNTMPQWAGSCWYYIRFLDPHNDQEFASPEAINYWMPVDLYVGGAEHAVLHLLYSRFWHKVLYDLGFVNTNEPFRKLINQGMIHGRSSFVYRIKDSNTYVSYNLKGDHEFTRMHVDVNIVRDDELDLQAFKDLRPENANADFLLEDGKYLCGTEVEKMSKSLQNVVSPDDLIGRYGADTFRLYEMFLGPLEQYKPWNTNGIDGVFRFIKKFWRLFHDDSGNFAVMDEEANQDELRVVHRTIKKVRDDIERFSFNTAVSTFMICTNELSALGCKKRIVLEPLVITISTFAPHLAEELWQKLGHEESISKTTYPTYNEEFIQDKSFEYPVSVNGKLRVKMTFPVDLPNQEIEKLVLESEQVQKWTGGKAPKKVIIVRQRIVNVVV